MRLPPLHVGPKGPFSVWQGHVAIRGGPVPRPPPPARLPLLGAVLGHMHVGRPQALSALHPTWAASEDALSGNGAGARVPEGREAVPGLGLSPLPS